MPQIGEFIRHRTGYSGRIRTLSLDLEVAIVAVEASDADNAPDYRVHAGGEDGNTIGAGWKHSSEKAGEFISLQIDDPTFAQPVRAYCSKTATTRGPGLCNGRASAIAPRRTKRCRRAVGRRAK